MVRLKVITKGINVKEIIFQFLYGAIKSQTAWYNDLRRRNFQFLYGAIKSIYIIKCEICTRIFQFLYGAIKSG